MLQSEKLVLMNAVVRKNRAIAVLAKLLSTGFFHPFDAGTVSAGIEQIKQWQQEYESARWDDITLRFKKIVDETGFSPSKNREAATYIEAESTLGEIEEGLESLIEKRNQMHQQLAEIETILSKRIVYLPVPIEERYTFIHTEHGEIETEKISLLEKLLGSIPHLLIPAESRNKTIIVFVVILKRDIGVFEKIKKEIGWMPVTDVLISSTPVEELKRKTEELKSEIGKINEEIHKIAARHIYSLGKIAVSLDIHQKLNQARKDICATETVTLLSGWIPEQKKQTASEIIRKTDPASYTEFVPAELSGVPAEEIPVKMNHNRFLKPFELIVGTYGVPRYGTIDPTLFIAISFLLMFGAMFGDTGHGAIFLFAGIIMMWRMKDVLKEVGMLLSYVGLSSIIFGFLYGSIFGIEFHPLWINPMKDISVLFRACIAFGIFILTTGIFINIVNLASNKNLKSVFFDKAGLFSGLIYWAGIGLASGFLARSNGIIVKFAAALFGISIFAIFSNLLIDAIRKREGILVGFIEGSLHIFEIVMGYLANTVSFIRISAFALNHFGFFITIFAISDMLKRSSMSGLSLPFLIFGNIFVICLEGLVVMIQSLRLNYYEFFSRFFVAGRSLYNPLVLKASSENIEQYLS